jgi:RNA polymerase sigma-70 factor (ECF subfamily)
MNRVAVLPMNDARAEVPLRARFEAVAREHAAALQRFARGYERDEDRQHDLVQEILIAIWRALPSFEARSSLRTWVYRIAHNVAVSHVMRGARDRLAKSVPLEDVDALFAGDAAKEMENRDAVARVAVLVRALKPSDAALILLYLEGLDHAEIAEITGHTPTNVAVKAHRIKDALRRALGKGERE